MALNEKDDVPAVIAGLTAFIKKARIAGRAEIESEGEVGLSLVSPETYQSEIIGKITEDAKKLGETVGPHSVARGSRRRRVDWLGGK